MEKNTSGGAPQRRPAGAPRASRPRGVEGEVRGRAVQVGRPTEVTQPAQVDLQREKVVPLAEVPKLGIIPRRRKGARLNLRTLYRWASVGLRGVILPSQLVGAQRVTSVEALLRFFDAVSAASRPRRHRGAGKPRPTSDPNVDEELDRLGV